MAQFLMKMAQAIKKKKLKPGNLFWLQQLFLVQIFKRYDDAS